MKRRDLVFLALTLAIPMAVGLAEGNAGQAPGQAPVSAGATEISGQLSIVWGDPGPGGGASSRCAFFLTDDQMRTLELHIDDDVAARAGGLIGLDRQLVTVQGVPMAAPGVADSSQDIVNVMSIMPVSRTDAALPAEEGATTGSKPWISIMCKFSDVAAEPRSLSFFQGMYAGSKPGLDHYWREQSFDAANVAGSGAAGWLTLPRPRSYYVYDQNSDGKDEANLTRLVNDAVAVADPSINFSSYVGINLMFNDALDCCAWGGTRWMTIDGVSKVWSVTWEPPWAYSSISVIAHEMGHGFGLPHSSGNYGATYDNPWDVMSQDRVNCGLSTDPTYGCMGQHTISYHKDMLGWLAGRRIDVAANSSATVTIDPIASPSTGCQMIKIPIGGTARYYTVEARKRAGYDAKVPGDAVVIHEVDPSRAAPAHVVDADGNGNNNDGGTMWVPGETFTDATAGIAVTVHSATGSGFNVTVINGNAGVAPAITVHPAPQTVWAGTSYTMTAAASGTPTPTVVWQYSSDGGSTWNNITWATLTTFTWPVDVTYNNILKRAVFTNSAGSAATNAAALRVRTPGDFNSDLRPDILWRNGATGQALIWFMNNAANTGYSSLGSVDEMSWKVAACGDLNDDFRTDILWRNTATGQNLVWFMNGAAYAGYAYLDPVSDLNWTLAVVTDFNGDGKHDLLWRNASTGQNLVWYMNGVTYAGYSYLPAQPDSNWKIAGAADFNADGKADLLWRNTATGQNLLWYLNGAILLNSAPLEDFTDVNWSAAMVADFDADGRPDLLWRNYATGQNLIWYLNNAAHTSNAQVDPVADTNWVILQGPNNPARTALPGDYNLDALPDILWRNSSTGQNIIWFMNGASYVRYQWVEPVADTNWKSLAAADFNRDGNPDIFWRNTATGQNIIWFMNGAAYSSYAWVDTVPADWRLAAAADFNSDGKPDLLWRNVSSGENIVWLMDGSAYVRYARLDRVADTNWMIVGAADFNGDGKPDLVWRNSSTGQNALWYMNNTAYIGYAAINTNADTDWKIVLVTDFNSDGRPDLLWRNSSTGHNIVWYMNNAAYVGYSWVSQVADTNWKIGQQQ